MPDSVCCDDGRANEVPYRDHHELLDRASCHAGAPACSEPRPMHVPAHFAVTDRDTLFDFMTRHSFALLVSSMEGEPLATHVPLLLDRTAGPHGALRGHVARANPHWQSLDGRRVLAVFSGPH